MAVPSWRSCFCCCCCKSLSRYIFSAAVYGQNAHIGAHQPFNCKNVIILFSVVFCRCMRTNKAALVCFGGAAAVGAAAAAAHLPHNCLPVFHYSQHLNCIHAHEYALFYCETQLSNGNTAKSDLFGKKPNDFRAVIMREANAKARVRSHFLGIS